MTDRWVPDPAPGDGPAGRGESGPRDALRTRQETEEAAMTGRFPDGNEVRDDSSPIEPESETSEREAVPFERDLPGVEITSPAQQRTDPGSHQATEGLDPGVATEHLSHASQGARPEQVDGTMEDDAG